MSATRSAPDRAEITRLQAEDDDSRRRIQTDLTINVVVEAGAGSGKTECLAQRMAAGIAAGDYTVDRMAAVTFTRKAAAELHGRFQQALEERLLDGVTEAVTQAARLAEGLQPLALSPQPDEARANIERALRDIEHLFAGTIHSFCARLLRERPVEAGVVPGFTELDEADNTVLVKRAFREYQAKLRADGDRLLIELAEAGIKTRELWAAFNTVMQYEDVDFPAEQTDKPDPTEAWKALDAFWKKVEPHLPKPIDPGQKCFLLGKVDQFLHERRVSKKGDPASLAELLKCWESKNPKLVMKWWGAGVTASVRDRILADLAVFRQETVVPWLALWRHYVYSRTIRFLLGARDHARELRMSAMTLSYNDLLILAAHVLRRDASVREALRAKYRWLFVDEFQDTDPLQAEVIMLLAGQEESEPKRCSPEPDAYVGQGFSPADANWRTVPLRPGSLFVVGDPKQSIYRFRRADIDIYTQVRQRIVDTGGVCLPLMRSFRSSPDVCEWVNRTFAPLFAQETEPWQPAFQPLLPKDVGQGFSPLRPRDVGQGFSPARHLAAGVSLLRIQDGKREAMCDDEAESIAGIIRSEVDAGAGHGSWGDYLVLTRVKKHLHRYASALERYGIPVEVCGAGAFGQSHEVEALIALLGVLADPDDEVRVVGVLRGAFFGVSDPELFTWRQSGGSFRITAPGPEGCVGQGFSPAHDVGPALRRASRVASSLSTLKTLYSLVRKLPASAAVEHILEATGILALAASGESGAPAGDLLHAVDRVRRVCERGGTLADAVEALDADRESNEVEAVSLEPGRRQVVRVMNLHKAKGLEADTVFLADPDGGLPAKADTRIIRDEAGAHGYFRVVKKKDGDENFHPKVLGEPKGWDSYEQEELRYVNAEQQRLLYVAGTRARRRLIVGQGSDSWNLPAASLLGAPSVPVPDTVARPEPAPVDLSPTARATATSERTRWAERLLAPTWTITSVTEGKGLGVAAQNPVSAVGQGFGPAESAVTVSVVGQGFRPAESATSFETARQSRSRVDAQSEGTLVHALLEHAVRHPDVTTAGLTRLATWLSQEETAMRPRVPELVASVERVRQSPVCREILEGDRREPEVPFVVRRELPDGTVHLLRGIIDVAWRSGSSWHIVDWKADAELSNDGLKSRHAEQVQTYVQVWTEVVCESANGRIVGVRTE